MPTPIRHEGNLVDIHEHISAICEVLGIDSTYVAEMNIRPDRVKLHLFRGKDGRCKGAKHIDLETGKAVMEWAEFAVRA